MCLAAIAFRTHPRYPLVVAANRDEFHAREAAPATWWPEAILAGRDRVASGTWLGVTRTGRFALLTNVREPSVHDPAAPSRGALVPAALASTDSPEATLSALITRSVGYNGFNLIAGDATRVAWGSNRGGPAAQPLEPGVHAISNGPLDAHWPKVVRLRDALARWAASAAEPFDSVWSALADRRIAPDDELPSTGVPLEWERMLSAPFIVGDRYGTRCSTLVTIAANGQARFVERSFDSQGRLVGEVDERFRVAARAPRREEAMGHVAQRSARSR